MVTIQNDINASTAVSALCISSIAVLASVYILKRKNETKHDCSQVRLKPEKWVKVGTVNKLIIYPIKSCAGILVDKAVVTTLGLKCFNGIIRDRDFMVVDDTGKMLTMTKNPRMSLVQLEISDDDQITLHAPDMPSIKFTYPEANGSNERLCKVKHDAHVRALDCGDEISQWFQEYLGDSGIRLYYHHLSYTQRTFEKYMYDCPQFEQSDMGAFHNETSYLLVAQESIVELNKRLAKDSSWRNWRPTILIDEVNEPFAEVNWSFVKIGDGNGILKTAVPCYRCPLTTVDQDTGILPKDGEPLKTLRQMKVAENKVADARLHEVLKNKGIMGLRLGLYLPAGEGAVISVGDPVYAALL